MLTARCAGGPQRLSLRHLLAPPRQHWKPLSAKCALERDAQGPIHRLSCRDPICLFVSLSATCLKVFTIPVMLGMLIQVLNRLITNIPSREKYQPELANISASYTIAFQTNECSQIPMPKCVTHCENDKACKATSGEPRITTNIECDCSPSHPAPPLLLLPLLLLLILRVLLPLLLLLVLLPTPTSSSLPIQLKNHGVYPLTPPISFPISSPSPPPSSSSPDSQNQSHKQGFTGPGQAVKIWIAILCCRHDFWICCGLCRVQEIRKCCSLILFSYLCICQCT